jgi:hypothetical protein
MTVKFENISQPQAEEVMLVRLIKQLKIHANKIYQHNIHYVGMRL